MQVETPVAALTGDEGFDHLDDREIRGIDGFTWQAVTAARVLDDLARREQKVIKGWPRREFKIEARQSAS